MTGRQSLNLKLVMSVLAAFALSMAFTWGLQGKLSRDNAYRSIDRTFDDLQHEIERCVNERLVQQCMAAREHLDEGWPTDTPSMRKLAETLNVTDLSLVDTNGIIVASSEPDYLAHDDRPAFDFKTAGEQAAAMLCLLTGPETEYCQVYRPNSANGTWRKYVGVWRPQGGFVEIGCDGAALLELARSSLVGIASNWHVDGTGGAVITTPTGLVLSDYAVPNREGTYYHRPDDSFYWAKQAIHGFINVYVMVPKASAAIQRNMLVGFTAALNGAALVLVAILVGLVIASFVRRQLREQAAKDFKMATEIQASALPSVFPPFPEETGFAIWASMRPAREVGGDFYDFYFVDSEAVLVLVADVSGKGVPAALFMMRAKTLIKSAAQTGKPLSQVMEEVNDALCEGNASNMFVTAWAGVLNVRTGRMTFVSAGHNPPLVGRGAGFEYLRSAHSLVLGAMPGIRYRTHELQLGPGDVLYLYTDGITEQPNGNRELFGEDRLLSTVRENRDRSQAELLAAVLAAVDRHADGVEQADDRTQLVLRYRGGRELLRGTYAPTMAGLARATGELGAALKSLPTAVRARLMVAADEIFANIVRYSQATEWSLTAVETHFPEGVRLILTDDGIPFDPILQRDPDTALKAEERPEGGLGIFIVKKTMSPVTYRRRDGKNVLIMGKDYGDRD